MCQRWFLSSKKCLLVLKDVRRMGNPLNYFHNFFVKENSTVTIYEKYIFISEILEKYKKDNF